jgi:hypothetical protein
MLEQAYSLPVRIDALQQLYRLKKLHRERLVFEEPAQIPGGCA